MNILFWIVTLTTVAVAALALALCGVIVDAVWRRFGWYWGIPTACGLWAGVSYTLAHIVIGDL